jgi:hypothetical protein
MSEAEPRVGKGVSPEMPFHCSVGFNIVTLVPQLEENLIINDVQQSLPKPTGIA